MDHVQLTDEERQARRAEIEQLIEVIRPAVQVDGGDLVLKSLDVESGVAEVQLRGSCSSCAISGATLQTGVARILQERVEWITEVIGDVDDSIGFAESVALGRGNYIPR
jgi:Fe-S cluster biogenesis protein NfuA